MTAQEGKWSVYFKWSCSPEQNIYYFGGSICSFICSSLLISANRKKLGWVLGKEGLAQVPWGYRELNLLFIETLNLFLRSKVWILNSRLIYNIEPV